MGLRICHALHDVALLDLFLDPTSALSMRLWTCRGGHHHTRVTSFKQGTAVNPRGGRIKSMVDCVGRENDGGISYDSPCCSRALYLPTSRWSRTTSSQQVYGLDLSKPQVEPTPEDYSFEHGVPDTPMTRRFGHLRGQKVKTVSETVSQFFENVSSTACAHTQGALPRCGCYTPEVSATPPYLFRKQGLHSCTISVAAKSAHLIINRYYLNSHEELIN